MKYYTYRRQIPKLKPGERIDFRKGKGYFVIRPVAPKPIDVVPGVPPVSVFSGKGLFSTTDSQSAEGHNCGWFALQMDPEGDESPYIPSGAVKCWWQARPTTDIVSLANDRKIPYIAQAETQPELEVALQCKLVVPHALVGNPSAWDNDEKYPRAGETRVAWVKRFMNEKGRAPAYASDWDLILEWYWNEQPYYTSPDAGGYPLFRNVCFGTYPAENAAHRGNRVYVPQYRQVWKGPFSCWPSEGMTSIDWEFFDAA